MKNHIRKLSAIFCIFLTSACRTTADVEAGGGKPITPVTEQMASGILGKTAKRFRLAVQTLRIADLVTGSGKKQNDRIESFLKRHSMTIFAADNGYYAFTPDKHGPIAGGYGVGCEIVDVNDDGRDDLLVHYSSGSGMVRSGSTLITDAKDGLHVFRISGVQTRRDGEWRVAHPLLDYGYGKGTVSAILQFGDKGVSVVWPEGAKEEEKWSMGSGITRNIDWVSNKEEPNMRSVAIKTVRPAGAPEYADVCFRYGWIRAEGPASVDNAKKAMRAFHATRVDWFYPGSHTMQPGAVYVTPEAKAFIDWCHANGMKVGGAMNTNTTDPKWSYRKHHLTRFVGEVKNPEFAAMCVAWGKAQIDAGVDTIVCDDIFKYDTPRKQIWSDNVMAKIKAHKPGFTMAGNNGGTIGTDYVKRYAVDFHYSDNNFVPGPRQWWDASRAHRALNSALLTHPNRHMSKDTRRQQIALAYAAGAHVITPWDEYIHGKARLFADPADFADLYGFARALGQAGLLNGYEDAAVGGFDLKENRYGKNLPIIVEGGSGKLSVFARAKPGDADSPVVLHLIESGEPKATTLRIPISVLFGSSNVKCRLLLPIPYDKTAHNRAETAGDYGELARTVKLKPKVEGDRLALEIPPMTPWGVIILEKGKL